MSRTPNTFPCVLSLGADGLKLHLGARLPRALTAKQRDVLQLIGDRLLEGKDSPTVRELGSALGLHSSCTVQRHIEALDKKGYALRDERYRYRDLNLTPQGWAELGVGACPYCDEPPQAPLIRVAPGQVWHVACLKAVAEKTTPQLLGTSEQLERSGNPGELEVAL